VVLVLHHAGGRAARLVQSVDGLAAVVTQAEMVLLLPLWGLSPSGL
jgi:hypothetical protein